MQVEAAATKLGKDSEAAANLEQATVHLLNALAEGRGLIGFLETQELGDCDAVAAVASFTESMHSLTEQRQQTLRFDRPAPDWPSIAKSHRLGRFCALFSKLCRMQSNTLVRPT